MYTHVANVSLIYQIHIQINI